MGKRKCRVCGKKFQAKICTQKYCSKKCYNVYYTRYRKIRDRNIKKVLVKHLVEKEPIKNENRPIKSLIEEEFVELDEICEELKSMILNSYKCACCGNISDVEEHYIYENRKYKLVKVNIINSDKECRHHIIPRKHGENDDETNLIFLCHECHDYIEIMTEEWIQSGKHYDIDILKSLIINNGFQDEICQD